MLNIPKFIKKAQYNIKAHLNEPVLLSWNYSQTENSMLCDFWYMGKLNTLSIIDVDNIKITNKKHLNNLNMIKKVNSLYINN